MRKFYIFITIGILTLGLCACGPNAPKHENPNVGVTTPAPAVENNHNSSNANADAANANTANSNVNSANTNVKKGEAVPEYSDANTALLEGNKFFDANETEKAIDALNQAIKLNPNLPEAHFKLGVIQSLLEKEKNTEVEVQKNAPEANKSTKKQTKQEEPVKKESYKQFEEAIIGYNKILAKNPKDDVAHFNLARSYAKIDKDKEAESEIRKAANLKPNDSEYQTELGAILVDLAKYDQAIGVLKKAIKLDETNSQAQDLLERAQGGKKRQDYGIPKEHLKEDN